MIQVKNLCYSIGNNNILKEVSLQVKNNQFVGIVGANGCGKSTLLKNIYRFLKCKSGQIKIENIDIDEYSGKELAKKISVLVQKQNVNFDFTVEEIVEMGRYAKFDSVFLENKKAVEKALDSVGMLGMKGRSFLTLSGGEMQRVFIARALASDTNILILDEPTNHLDIRCKIHIMDLIKQQHKAVLAVIHDMNIASKYCDYIVAIKNGEVIKCGKTKDVFTKKNIKEIFDVECDVVEHREGGYPVVIF